MENRQLLQFAEPQLKTWTSDNFLMSSIWSKETSYDWFMNYYVNTLSVVKHEMASPPSFMFHPACVPTTSQFLCNVWDICPFIDKNTLNREIVKTCYQKFTDFMTDFISKGYFICATFGQSKIRRRNFSHKAYVTGYDRDLKLVYMADNIDYGRFQNFTMSFDDVDYAFFEADEFIPMFDKDHQMEENSIYLIKPKDFQYKFDLNLLLQFLSDYLNAVPGTGFLANIRNTPYRKDTFYYGFKIYNILDDYLNRILDNSDYNDVDDRIFTFIYDHKAVMQKRIPYLFSNCDIDIEPMRMLADESVKNAILCLNLYLKFGLTYKKEIIEKIKKILVHLKQMDTDLYTELTAKLHIVYKDKIS